MSFNIRAAKETDLIEVARVHKICFPNSFSTRLGPKLLSNYYLEFYKENPHLFYVCENEDGKMCGFVMGYVLGKTNAISSFSKNNRITMALKVMGLLICFDKLAWNKVKKTLKKKPASDSAKKIDKTGEGDLLSICVTDEMKGTGAAVALVDVYNDALKAHGHKFCYLTCDTDNPRGLAFYKKIGYSIVEQTKDKICFGKEL